MGLADPGLHAGSARRVGLWSTRQNAKKTLKKAIYFSILMLYLFKIMSKKRKSKFFFTRALISALIASFVLGFSAGALTDDASAASKSKTASAVTKTKKTSKTTHKSVPATDCASVKLRYYQALSDNKSPSKTDQGLASQCAVKEKKMWNKNPNSSKCKTIKKYESKKQLTSMVKKKKMNWTDYFYCKATYWNKK